MAENLMVVLNLGLNPPRLKMKFFSSETELAAIAMSPESVKSRSLNHIMSHRCLILDLQNQLLPKSRD